jgi:hypothetical protein
VGAAHHYCTLFDRRYLARAVALHRSLERHDGDFVLRAVCMDADSETLLRRLGLPRMRVCSIAEIERADPELRAVRDARASWEYCWTSTPAICRYFLELEPELDALTYLDADLHFSSSPSPLYEELGEGSVLLIPHRALPETDRAIGIYNVGWVTFSADERGRTALTWWRERCLEWCYDRIEETRFGDQKYLDDWPERFSGVVVSALAAAGLGPWNDTAHEIVDRGSAQPPLVDGAPLIYFHHSGLRLYAATRLARLSLAGQEGFRRVRGPIDLLFGLAGEAPAPVAPIWRRYVDDLASALAELAAAGAPKGLFLDHPSRKLIIERLLLR